MHEQIPAADLREITLAALQEQKECDKAINLARNLGVVAMLAPITYMNYRFHANEMVTAQNIAAINSVGLACLGAIAGTFNYVRGSVRHSLEVPTPAQRECVNPRPAYSSK